MSLPHGFTVHLADGLLTSADGMVIAGGAPFTAIRLSPKAREMLHDGCVTVSDDASAYLTRRLLTNNLAHPHIAGSARVTSDELTVVIPVRDRPGALNRALASLDGLRLIVVDDASADPAAIERVCHQRGATFIPLDHNLGPGAARNVGLARVQTAFVAFVDSDVEVTTAELLALTRHFADPEVVLVGPRVVGSPSSARPRWFEKYDAVSSSLTLGRTPSYVRPGSTVAWLPSACLVARAEALCDGFDPSLRVGEDVDLVWRLAAAGRGVRYDPTVTARHETRPTLRAWLGRKFVYGTGGAPLAKRHGGAVAPAVLTPMSAAAALAILLRTRWSPPAAGAAILWSSAKVRRSLPETEDRAAIALQIAWRGLGWSVRQESSLLVRHWWPAVALAGLFSSHARRAIVTAAAVDAVQALREARREGAELPAWVVLVGRRLDDFAYGAGLWVGAVRLGSIRPLLVRRPGL